MERSSSHPINPIEAAKTVHMARYVYKGRSLKKVFTKDRRNKGICQWGNLILHVLWLAAIIPPRTYSEVAQRQSGSLLTRWSRVRSPPSEPYKNPQLHVGDFCMARKPSVCQIVFVCNIKNNLRGRGFAERRMLAFESEATPRMQSTRHVV